jgi:hypothetical protein
LHTDLTFVRFKTTALALFLVLVLVLSSCHHSTLVTSTSVITTPSVGTQSFDSPIATSTKSPADTYLQVTPLPSVAVMTGQIVSFSTGQPLTSMPVHLAKVFWNEENTDGAYVLNNAQSPSTATDSKGFFVFKNLEPADYVLVVGEIPEGNTIVSNPDGSAKVFVAKKGKITDLGKISIRLPDASE